MCEEEDENWMATMLCEWNETLEIFTERKVEGAYNALIRRHLLDEEEKFREYFRLSTSLFHFILNVIKYDIFLYPCNRVQEPISPEEKLCLALRWAVYYILYIFNKVCIVYFKCLQLRVPVVRYSWLGEYIFIHVLLKPIFISENSLDNTVHLWLFRFLATGESYRSLTFEYRISLSYFSILVPVVLKAICQRLQKKAIPEPTEIMLMKSEEGFLRTWNYPNCVGTLDGKHACIICPKKSASLYFNYKQYFSIVVFALVDSNYKFLAIDVGSFGKEGDASIHQKSQLGKNIDGNKFPFPGRKALPNTNTHLPHIILADEALSLTTNVMKCYPRQSSQAHTDLQKAIYNYRHCPARCVVENAFGILCQYFLIIFIPIAVKRETVSGSMYTS